MDIRGNEAHLSDEEQKKSGLGSPLLLTELDPVAVIDDLNNTQQQLEEMQAADDDELTHAERAQIAPSLDRLKARRAIFSALSGEFAVRAAGPTIEGVEDFLRQDS